MRAAILHYVISRADTIQQWIPSVVIPSVVMLLVWASITKVDGGSVAEVVVRSLPTN